MFCLVIIRQRLHLIVDKSLVSCLKSLVWCWGNFASMNCAFTYLVEVRAAAKLKFRHLRAQVCERVQEDRDYVRLKLQSAFF